MLLGSSFEQSVTDVQATPAESLGASFIDPLDPIHIPLPPLDTFNSDISLDTWGLFFANLADTLPSAPTNIPEAPSSPTFDDAQFDSDIWLNHTPQNNSSLSPSTTYSTDDLQLFPQSDIDFEQFDISADSSTFMEVNDWNLNPFAP